MVVKNHVTKNMDPKSKLRNKGRKGRWSNLYSFVHLPRSDQCSSQWRKSLAGPRPRLVRTARNATVRLPVGLAVYATVGTLRGLGPFWTAQTGENTHGRIHGVLVNGMALRLGPSFCPGPKDGSGRRSRRRRVPHRDPGLGGRSDGIE